MAKRNWFTVLQKSRLKDRTSKSIRIPTFKIFAMIEGFSEKETIKFLEDARMRGRIIQPKKGHIELV